MKKLLLAFVVLGFLVNLGYAETEDLQTGGTIGSWVQDKMKLGASAIGIAYDSIMSLAQNTTGSLVSRAYKGISYIYNNVISVLLGLIAFFWLFKHLKTSTISKEELFKAMVWIIIFVIVYALLNSRAAYDEVASWFFIPQHILNSIFGGQVNVSSNLIKIFGDPLLKTFTLGFNVYGDFTSSISLLKFQYIAGIPITQAIMSIYLLYLVIALAVSVAVAIMHLYSTFLAGIYLTFLPIVISLIIIPQTKALFGAWVKSFVGITAYIPLSNIALNILNANPAKASVTGEVTSSAMQAVFIYSLTGILLGIASILILYKIPTWISELLGVANQGVGAGGVIGMARSAADGLSKASMSRLSPLANLGRAATNSSGSKVSSGLSALSGGIINPNAISAAGGLIKSGFKAIGKHFGKNKAS